MSSSGFWTLVKSNVHKLSIYPSLISYPPSIYILYLFTIIYMRMSKLLIMIDEGRVVASSVRYFPSESDLWPILILIDIAYIQLRKSQVIIFMLILFFIYFLNIPATCIPRNNLDWRLLSLVVDRWVIISLPGGRSSLVC